MEIRKLSETFEEIFSKAALEVDVNDKEVVKRMINAVKEYNKQVVGEEEEPSNVEHPFYLEEVQEYEKREELKAEIRQRQEELL